MPCENTHTEWEGSFVKTEAEIGVTWLQAKESEVLLASTKTRIGQGRILFRKLQRQHSPINILIFRHWPPVLG